MCEMFRSIDLKETNDRSSFVKVLSSSKFFRSSFARLIFLEIDTTSKRCTYIYA